MTRLGRDLYAMRRTIVQQARAAGRARFYHERWDGFVGDVRAFARTRRACPGRPASDGRGAFWPTTAGAARRAPRSPISSTAPASTGGAGIFFTLNTERRVRQRPNFSITDYAGYKPLSQFAKELRETARALRRRGEPAPPRLRFRRGMGRRSLYRRRT